MTLKPSTPVNHSLTKIFLCILAMAILAFTAYITYNNKQISSDNYGKVSVMLTNLTEKVDGGTDLSQSELTLFSTIKDAYKDNKITNQEFVKITKDYQGLSGKKVTI